MEQSESINELSAALAKAQLQLGSYVYLIGSMLGFYGVTRGSDIRLDLNKSTRQHYLYYHVMAIKFLRIVNKLTN